MTEIRRIGAYIAAAMLFRDREYTSRSLFRRLTAVLAVAFTLVMTLGIVGLRAFPRTYHGLIDRDVPGWFYLVWVALTLWIAVRQLLLLGSRFRAADTEMPYAGLLLYYLGPVLLPAAVFYGLIVPDSDQYLRHRQFIAERSRLQREDAARLSDRSQGREI